MKGDFTRFTHRPEQHYTRVLKQQGRVDVDADWNEAVEIITHLERVEAIDVIGRCGVPSHGGGFKVDLGGSGPTISRGRIYVDGILCCNEDEAGPALVPLNGQADLPGYSPALTDDGVYIAYLDVWERHITYIEDPELREVALGGPDTTTRTRTLCQVKLAPLGVDAPLDTLECVPFPALPASGRLTAQSEIADEPSNPCVVPASAGYRGLENRLYRVEIHHDGRDAEGNPDGPPTFKWSRDNGSVVLPIAEGGIAGNEVTLRRLGRDEVLTVKVGDWVEVLGDETELYGRPGALAAIAPDGIDRTDLVITADEPPDSDISTHIGEGHLKMRRWDHHATAEVALEDDGALPIQADWFELEDGVQVRFDTAATYHVGDYWVIPARTRQGDVLWPEDGGVAAELPRLGIEHHYCTLALVRREGGAWTEARDCRSEFPPLTEVERGGCCLTVRPGESVQQAIDTVVGRGGGCISLCRGVHRVTGPLRLRHAADVSIGGESAATVLRFDGVDDSGDGGLIIDSSERINVHDLLVVSDSIPALMTVRHDEDMRLSRQIALRRLLMLNRAEVAGAPGLRCALRLAHADDVLLEECRLAAEVGIVSLWGNSPSPAADDALADDAEAVALGFEDLDLGTRYRVGNSFVTSGVTVTARPFQWGNGQTTDDGYAEVENDGQAGGSGQDMHTNNINLHFNLPSPCAVATLLFGDYGGNSNICVNGEFRNVNDVFALDGQLIGGVRISATPVGTDQTLGILRLQAGPDPISDFFIGGQELWIDEFTCVEGIPGEPPTRYGAGVSDLAMRDCAVRYRHFGVLAMRSVDWQIDRCAIEPFDAALWAALAMPDPQQPPGGVADDVFLTATAPPDRAAPLRFALELLFNAPVDVSSGTAIQAFLWRDCALRQSRLAGARGVDVWWWMGGAASENRVVARQSGLSAFWLHKATLRENQIACSEGAAIAFVGSYKATLSANCTQGLHGCLRASFRSAMLELYRAHLRAAVSAYDGTATPAEDQALLRLFLDESLRVMGLTALVDRIQTVLDSVYTFTQVPAVQAWLQELGMQPPFDAPPQPLLVTLSQWWYESLRDFVEQPQEPPWWVRIGPAIPVIALSCDGNDMSSDADTVLLEQFITLGGLRITDNRLDSLNGQTARINVWPYASNVAALLYVVRWMLDQFIELIGALNFLRSPDLGDDDVNEAYAPLGTAIGNLIDATVTKLRAWLQGLDLLAGTDYRIAGNTLHSLNTAIESNLFELAVLRNHITLRERRIANNDLTATLDNLAGDAQLGAVGNLASTGDANGINAGYDAIAYDASTYPLYLDDANSFDRAAIEYRMPGVFVESVNAPQSTGSRCADALAPAAGTPGVTVNWRTLDADIRADTAEFRLALDAGERQRARMSYLSIAQRVQAGINTSGIWVKAAGCRVVGNHVLVPQDLDENSWARGGVRIQGDDRINLLLLLLFVMQALLDDFDPVMGITETVVDGNEIIGGVGNGIEVLETAGGGLSQHRIDNDQFSNILPFQTLVDLKVRGNQIRGMAGAGLAIDRATLAVNVEIENNFITDCSNTARARGFSQERGGIVISHAALCRLRGNQISKCAREVSAAGVSMASIIGLSLADNQVLANGGGDFNATQAGVLLHGVYGHVDVCDNELLYNASLGLQWDNTLSRKVVVSDVSALIYVGLLAAFYARHDFQDALVVHAVISNNMVRMRRAGRDAEPGTTGAVDTSFHLLPSGARLILNANACYGGSSRIRDVAYGAVTSNVFEVAAAGATTLSIDGMGAGVITSNGSDGEAIHVVNAMGVVEHGFNVPPIII